jgi:hypothetical protein
MASRLNPRVLLTLSIVLLVCAPLHAQQPAAKVYVVLWFDTEDYILPASDDAAKWTAEWLTKEGIRATFKVVGEKARTLEKRGRTDVIEALKKHEIGYHSNYHSWQPTPAMYLAHLGWDEGVAEFDRRERPGYDDLKRIFGQTPSCYGQPGSSWGPQSYGAMQKWGMHVYLDAGSHVHLNNKPHYYCGVLTMYKLDTTIRNSLSGPEDLKRTEDRFLQARTRLLAEGGGLVSIYYHPCEFTHKEFWDGVNFRRGANPPREQWKLPPAKTHEESQDAFQQFKDYISFVKRFPDVQFITASEALEIYKDRAKGRTFTAKELRTIAAEVKDEVNIQRHGDLALAPGEVFRLLNHYLADRVSLRMPTELKLESSPYGPAHAGPVLKDPVTTDWSQFKRTVMDVEDYLKHHGKVPSVVWLGSVAVPPEAYLTAIARVAVDMLDGKPVPDQVEVRPGKFTVGQYVADDDPKLWGWVIFPPGHRAPLMMELARRQAWTIKPALLQQR